MMRKYHIHCYKVVGMFEVDFIAESEEAARDRASKLVNYPLEWRESDKKIISVVHEGREVIKWVIGLLTQ